jgi:hypothetical protein
MPKLRKDRSKQCDICGRTTNINNIVCSRCERTTVLKDVPTSTDYCLSKDDWFINAMAFIHACGQYEEFMDKVSSSYPELMMGTWSNGPGIIEDLIDSSLLDEYDETCFKGTYRGFFDVKPLVYRKKKNNVN